MEPNTTLEPSPPPAEPAAPAAYPPAGQSYLPPVAQPPYAPPTPTPRRGPPGYVWVVGGVLGVFLLSAAACVALALGVAGVVGMLGSMTEQRDTITHSFAAAGTPSVALRNVTGNATIVTGADGTVQVEVTRRARAMQTQAARDDLRQIVVGFSQSGSAVTVDVRYPSNVGPGRMLSADVLVTVPQAANLDVQGVTGTLTATGVTGTLAVRLVTGDVELRQMAVSGASHVQLTTGELIFDGALAPGAALDARLVTGSVAFTLPADTPARLQADTMTGDISVHGWPIPVSGSVTSRHAAGDLGQQPTGALSIRVTTGSIELTAR